MLVEMAEDTQSGVATLACPDMTLDLTWGDEGATADLGAVYGVVHLDQGMFWVVAVGRRKCEVEAAAYGY